MGLVRAERSPVQLQEGDHLLVADGTGQTARGRGGGMVGRCQANLAADVVAGVSRAGRAEGGVRAQG